MAMFCSCLCLKLFLLVSVVGSEETILDKRILLSDPSYIQTLEAKLQELTQKVSELTSKLSTQESKNSAQDATVTSLEKQVAALAASVSSKSDSGGIFVRWGRNTCPHNVSELVYNGYAGGSWYDHPGGAAEYICMPSDPEMDANAGTSHYGLVYGVEYGQLVHGHRDDDAPCTVCRTTTTSSVLMIPGRSSCYPGWTLLFSGMLAAGYYGYDSSNQYVCVDNHPEFVPHSSRDDNGKLFGHVSSQCGSLACPPYINGVNLACVVCAK